MKLLYQNIIYPALYCAKCSRGSLVSFNTCGSTPHKWKRAQYQLQRDRERSVFCVFRCFISRKYIQVIIIRHNILSYSYVYSSNVKKWLLYHTFDAYRYRRCYKVPCKNLVGWRYKLHFLYILKIKCVTHWAAKIFHSVQNLREIKKILRDLPGGKVHEANMGPTWVLSALDGPHVGPINLAIRAIPPNTVIPSLNTLPCWLLVWTSHNKIDNIMGSRPVTCLYWLTTCKQLLVAR